MYINPMYTVMRHKKIPTELLKGNTRTLILGLLREGPAHGYAITHEIERRTESAIAFRQGTLYPLLHEMEREGLVVGEWGAFGTERPKKIYRITDKGLEQLTHSLEAWKRLNWAMDRVMGDFGEQKT